MAYLDPEKQRAYQREWLVRQRAAWFAVNGPCVDCSSWDQLELDHADGSTKVGHRIWSWSRVRREAELAKCVARCRTCHIEKSKGEAHCRAQLTEDLVREIRLRASNGESLRSLARFYGRGYSTIRKVVTRKTWSHVS